MFIKSLGIECDWVNEKQWDDAVKNGEFTETQARTYKLLEALIGCLMIVGVPKNDAGMRRRIGTIPGIFADWASHDRTEGRAWYLGKDEELLFMLCGRRTKEKGDRSMAGNAVVGMMVTTSRVFFFESLNTPNPMLLPLTVNPDVDPLHPTCARQILFREIQQIALRRPDKKAPYGKFEISYNLSDGFQEKMKEYAKNNDKDNSLTDKLLNTKTVDISITLQTQSMLDLTLSAWAMFSAWSQTYGFKIINECFAQET